MKKRTSHVALLLAVLTILSCMLTGCGGSPGQGSGSPDDDSSNADSSSTTGEVITIKLAGTVSEDHPITMAERKFAELLEEKSGGAMKVEVYPNGQLGSNREIYESMQNGSIQMAEAGAVILANFTEKFKFAQLPFLFDSPESFQAFFNGEVGQQMVADIEEETGFRILSCFENGMQALTNSKHAVKTPADLSGLKIRTQENDILLQIYSEMGAAPMPMAFTELFTGMQQGTVDGQVNPILIAYTGKYDEVQDYCTDINAVYDVAAVSVNSDFYNNLTDEQRGWLDEAVKEATEYNLQLSVDAATEAAENLNVEMTWLTTEERAAFAEAASGVFDWFTANVNEPKLDEYIAEIDRVNQLYADGKLEPVTGNVIG
ncbi:MAG: TRAP transporter substrate-binding protein [Oscillibacter sp.]|nr:TRAP transporter substrate-binding protein [Oscillibacter sp.]